MASGTPRAYIDKKNHTLSNQGTPWTWTGKTETHTSGPCALTAYASREHHALCMPQYESAKLKLWIWGIFTFGQTSPLKKDSTIGPAQSDI